MLKVWIARLWGSALTLVGALLVLQLIALLVWQYGIAIETRNWPALSLRLLFVDHAELGTKAVAPFLPFIPEVQWTWFRDPANRSSVVHQFTTWALSQVHIGLVPAILGAALALKGVLVVLPQKDRLAAIRQYAEDRRRRVHEYRRQQQSAVEPKMARDEADVVEAAEQAWRRERVRVLRG